MLNALFSLLLIGVLSAPAAASENAGKLDALVKRYLDGLFRAKPHLATFMGDHRFDGALPELGAAAGKKRDAELVAQKKELDAIVATGDLGDDGRADAQILGDGIALELLYLREIRDWEWDPRLYDSFPYYDPREIVGGRLSDIIHGDFAPAAERKKSVVAQLAALPKFLADEQEALAHPRGTRHTPKVYVEQGIKANKGNLDFFAHEVKPFVGDDPAYAPAVAALERYQKFLETELGAHADGDWRLGATLYGKKFPLALQTTMSPAALLARAKSAFGEARAQLYGVCKKLHAQLWPKDALPDHATAAQQQKVIQRVVDEISKDHPKPDELVAAHARNLDALRAFIEKHDLLALPPRETLRVEPMPEFKRGAVAAEYLAPGVLLRNPKWHATYYVDPIDPTWPADKVESYLRGQNNYQVQLVASHEAYPGHHTQYFYSKRNLDPLRAVLWNGAMVEGWAVYGEGLMVGLGWGGDKNDRFRVYNLIGDMISATNTIIDIELQSGHMSDDEAVRFMVEEGFQPRAQAEKKLKRAKLDSTQLCQYFLGLDEIQTLERDYRKKVGARFNQRAFNEALISHGSIAVKFLRDYVIK
ncbi:MAG: hypothetical protein JWM53_123 [bacterium]|nr:hypothetical protein [bacterium]